MSATVDGANATTRAPKRSLWQRFILTLKLRLAKALVTGVFKIWSLPGIRNKADLPTYTKTYPVQASLVNRVFIPKTWKSGEALPLYLDIHGGGFAICSPIVDDPFCRHFAETNKVVVVSLDYPKAPSHKYPVAVNALVDTIKAVLSDSDLPIDKKKVAVGGFSAGANLSLAVTQNKDIREKVGGVVAFYPPVDFVTKGPEKMKTRPIGAPGDPLENGVAMFDYGYTPVGQSLTDPQLSPLYAEREALPGKLCIFGCEYDLLCKEAELFAEKMAGGAAERKGSNDLWEKNGVRWEKVLGELHGFDQMISTGETKVRTRKRRVEMWNEAAAWLSREVYA